jgi:hypothetical protein
VERFYIDDNRYLQPLCVPGFLAGCLVGSIDVDLFCVRAESVCVNVREGTVEQELMLFPLPFVEE